MGNQKIALDESRRVWIYKGRPSENSPLASLIIVKSLCLGVLKKLVDVALGDTVSGQV